ncbi:fumarylacetoacetate hydrolase family protein [Oceanibacterium hippocampi]|uniref:Ureidoglycolate lyase n=1 Tax=Oceanibacterium hippocampi TaxID=745714 RepID=A0A1Y5T9V3_9PROT|nr:fumarylacetoacetate hydrolase family protein [Oceanibacterium hippocampi]SLN58900.1 Ureidoglycolate lyase [Oceanibacterium hippocampi]
MKLVRFGPKGAEKPGMIDGQGTLRDLSGVIDDVAGDVLLPAGLAKLAGLDAATLPTVPGTPRLGPCVGRIGKLVCIGLNYSDHAAEAGVAPPAEPVIFLKANSSICGPDDPILLPRGSQKTDWEVELAFVIGKGGRYIEEADWADHVAGYCVCNDVSERAYQLESTGQWTKGKSADNFAPLGPWLVTADEIADPQALDLWLDVDGVRQQAGNTGTMIFPVREIIAYVSRFMTLEPGDVISTGTPPGVGMGKKPPTYLRKGQTVTLGVDGLGAQRQAVIDWDDRPL